MRLETTTSCRTRLSRLGLIILSCLLPLAATGQDSSSPEALKRQADRWIELERRAADERNKWKADREILTASRDVLLKEQEALKTKKEANDMAVGLFSSRLEKTRGELLAHESSQGALSDAYDRLSSRIEKLATRLPAPLREKIDPFLNMLDPGAEDDPTPTSQRTQAVTSILSSIDHFNNTLTLTHELRNEDSGEVRDIKVLYWGLAVAYATDASGENTWILTPGSDGWQWQEANDQASSINALFQVYEKDRSPELIVLPVGAKGGEA